MDIGLPAVTKENKMVGVLLGILQLVSSGLAEARFIKSVVTGS